MQSLGCMLLDQFSLEEPRRKCFSPKKNGWVKSPSLPVSPGLSPLLPLLSS